MILNFSKGDRAAAVEPFLDLDLDNRKEFQDIVELASRLCDKPVALITLLDEHTNWIQVRTGFEITQVPRKTSFCHHTLGKHQVLQVSDAVTDERFSYNDLVTGKHGVRFYAGAPLVISSGHNIGALCLFDTKPGSLSEDQQHVLSMLSRQVVFLLEMELKEKQLTGHIKQIQCQNESLVNIAFIQSHNIRQPLTSIMGLVDIVRKGYQPVDQQWLAMIGEATDTLDARIREIVQQTLAEKDIKALRFSKMVEEIEDYAILLLDKDGKIENWNKGAQLLKGYAHSEIIGKNFSIFYTTNDLAENLPERLIQQAAQQGSTKTHGWRLRKDGSRFWASVLITAIHNELEEVIGFTKVTRLLQQSDPENKFSVLG
jgi:PAS domain S-box-containing protein